MSVSGHYDRVLLKLSGNAFAAPRGTCFEQEQLNYIAGEIAEITRTGCALAVVPGAGNILRGASLCGGGKSRLQADQAGMMATIVNGLVLQQSLEQYHISTHLCSALPVADSVKGFDRELCLRELDRGAVIILSGGTGNPLFTTDTAAALRAVQLDMDIVLKATRVNGVYSADPETDSSSKFFPSLRYEDVLNGKFAIMDFCAVDLCREHKMPIRVFNFREKGNLCRAVSGEAIGTLIGNAKNGS